jgi:chorismate mutase
MKKKNTQLTLDLRTKRVEIDQVDQKLLILLNRRIRLVSEAIAVKREMGEKIRNLKREKEILEKLKSKNKGPLKEVELKKVFRAIIGMCRRSLE